ncbi:EAL domain-containing protein [Kineococcus rubinsiae]|uniref:EAL domain-containing protein n=1 Tax=Kineococcus rubinsiae TaxID=2609562 RepID=UPI00142F9A1D|nr:EAL domain-containing protein [Kineococcus rubinsiae]NIZ90437.1 EAL domain-containing protein [Kineococcus rubinsiae]
MLDGDADAVAQLLDLARDVFGTPVAVLVRTGSPDGRAVVDEVSSTLPPEATGDLLASADLDRVPGAEVVRPDGEPHGRLLGLPAGDGPSARQLEALNVVAALVAGVLHHRELRRAEHELRLASLDALVAGAGRLTVLQPIVDLASGAVVGAEALSRFTTEDGQPQRPEQVFTDARSAGVGPAMERAAVVSALRLLPAVPAGVYLSLNASSQLLLDPWFSSLLLASDPGRLVVEVTEHDPVEDYAALATGTEALRRQGVRLAVDDAGAGFASLQHVLHLAPDIVKLDIAFVRGIDADPARRAVTRALVGFASELGSTVVAEGIERPDELSVLRDLGVACGQGYLLGRPAASPCWGAAPADTQEIPSLPRDRAPSGGRGPC